MSWTQLTPRPRASKDRFDVEIRISTRRLPLLTVSMREDILPSWKAGQRINAHLGEGEHRGKLRLVSGVSFELTKVGRPSDRLTVRLPLPDGVSEGNGKGAHPCEFRRDGEAVIISLPEWALPHASAPAPSKPVPATPALTQRGGVKNLTSSLMGDPPPGRSAAAQRGK